MKWTRHRCQLASAKILAIAPLSPSWESEITSLTPFRPRLTSPRRKRVQKDVVLGRAGIAAQHVALAVPVDAGLPLRWRPRPPGRAL
jgi:hypothetical protein